MKITKVTISLNIQANSKFIARNEKTVRDMVELCYFSELGLREEDIGGWIYQLTFQHTDEDDLKHQFSSLMDNIWSTADGYYCIVESDIDEGPDGREPKKCGKRRVKGCYLPETNGLPLLRPS